MYQYGVFVSTSDRAQIANSDMSRRVAAAAAVLLLSCCCFASDVTAAPAPGLVLLSFVPILFDTSTNRSFRPYLGPCPD